MDRADLFGLIYGTLFSPRHTMKESALRPRVGLSITIYVAVTVISALGSFPGLGLPFAGIGSILALLAGILFLLAGAALVHLASELLGGDGKVTTLLGLLALASLPQVFSVPLTLVGRRLPFLGTVGSIVLFIWVFVLNIIGIKETYKFSTGRALAACFLPGAAVALALMIVLIIGFTLANSPVLEDIIQEISGF